MTKKTFIILLSILYSFLICGSVSASSASVCNTISYCFDYAEEPKNAVMKIRLILQGEKGSQNSYELDAYKAIYEFGTNKLLDVQYETLLLDKPFQSSREHRLSLSLDLNDVDEKLVKTKVMLFDRNNELKPISVTSGRTNEWSSLINIPDYYYEEAQRVTQNIYNLYEEKSDHKFLGLGVMSDSHIGFGISEEAMLKESLSHGIYALNSVGYDIGCDFIVHLGDTTWKNNIDSYDSYSGSVYTTEAFQFVANYHNFGMQLIGNHDQTNDHIRQWTAIGQYNQFDETGLNPKRSYGYTDLPDKKVRVIALNTCDYLNGTGSYGISYEQRDFLMKSLDLSQKEDASEWKILILSHIPLDFYYKSAKFNDYDLKSI